MKVYRGRRDPVQQTADVWIDADGHVLELNPRLNLRNHSPTGFEWGYAGSGPAQLALAICADALEGNEGRACHVYQQYKFRVISKLRRAGEWSIPQSDVLAMIEKIETERVA